MTRPYMIEAKWPDGYTQLFIVFVVGTASLIVAFFIRKRRMPQQPALPAVALPRAWLRNPNNNAGYFAIDQEIENDIELLLHEVGHNWLGAVD